MKRDPLQPRPLLRPAEALAEANRCQGCVDAACRKGCPLAVDVGAFIRRIRTGNWAGALRVMYERNPLPETCAFICPVEAMCEGKCNSGQLGYPIRIAELQQAAAHYGAETFKRKAGMAAETTGAVAVVGGGPAGLACAAKLRLDGFEVHLFERTDMLGGALTWWIPAYRLPRKTLQEEIQRIVDLGVVIHTGQALGRDITLADLRGRFDAVFLGLGLGTDRASQIGGRVGAGVLDALEVLEQANAGQLQNLPEPVVVIGGGSTAIDAAVTARYLGAKEVYLIYRRGFVQMPAWPGERGRAVEVGVHVLILLRPIEYARDVDGRLLGVRCVRTKLETAANGGRDTPMDVPGSEFILSAGCVIEAIGQKADDMAQRALASLKWTPEGTLAIDSATGQTSLPGVFAGGDLASGAGTAAQAIAGGLAAAEGIARYIRKHKAR
jgi:glutamate synthase (NADPH/NADH) small chain